MARYVCGNPERRAAVEKSPLNGVDFLEVLDGKVAGHPEWDGLRQLFLAVRLLKPVPAGLSRDNARIDGGVRITPVRVVWALPLAKVAADPGVPAVEKAFLAGRLGGEPDPDHLLVVRTDSSGDYSPYRLRLVTRPADGFDPRLSEVEFTFKVECPSDFDCKPDTSCPPAALEEPEINYLAKDYASFRRLMLDRLSAIAPGWRERNPADLGVALVELLAYAGDQLSYYQDAVATEAYLGTARKRVSVRRHARLVDYFLHEGTNARAWIGFQVDEGSAADGLELPARTPVLTRWSQDGAAISPLDLEKAEAAGAVVFETLAAVTLHASHDAIAFYTWSDLQCCLPKGATAATLVQPAVDLKPGQLLLLEEVKGPRTGASEDADPHHRHVVRITAVTPGKDPLNDQDVVEVEWDAADALPFPLCVSAVTDDKHKAQPIDGVSVARGNLAPADHGYTVVGEDLGKVPDPEEEGPFRPELQRGPVTYAVPLPHGFAGGPASLLRDYRPADAAPAVLLRSGGEEWTPARDLLASGRFDRAFVAEVDETGRTRLRFGDDENGRAPVKDASFTATYRVGNGTAGNVGAGALSQVALAPARAQGITAVRNPLPAAGGVEPESLEEARQYAPQAFRVQQRAVNAADYAAVAQRHPEVQRAAATFRWTGSWYTVFLTVDRLGGAKVDAAFAVRLREHMERYRMAGYDLEVDGPRPVPLDLALDVCVKPDYLRSQVLAALLERFSNRLLADGRRGFFHPDDWTFGQPVYLSRIHAAAAAVAGVESVSVSRFQRRGRPAGTEIQDGVLPIGRLEIAVLDNDPNFQENGRLEIAMGGGR
ncbi:MAG TPA: putative baseplate assembly protein [Thermoanaerobaculia bacterium]